MTSRDEPHASSSKGWLQDIYIKHMKRKKSLRRRVLTVQLSIFFAILYLVGSGGEIQMDRRLCSSAIRPKFCQHMGNMISGELWGHLGDHGRGDGCRISAWYAGRHALAVFIWWSPFLNKVLDPYMVVFNSMPKVALGPIFIVMFGAGFTAIVVTTLSITVIVTTLVVYNSFHEVDSNLIKVVRTFGGTKRQVFQRVILPASYPAIVSTLKVNVGMAWVGVIVGEFLVAQSGLGYLIMYGFQVFNFTLVLSSLLIIAVVATAMYQMVVYIERKLLTHR